MLTLLEEITLTKTNLLPQLVGDYLAGAKKVSRLSKYPFTLDGFRQAIPDKASDKTDRRLLAEVLSGQYSDIPTSEKVKQNIALLQSEKTFTVTASHQPCLLLGPLYNIYKISGVINLARRLKQEFPEYNFVPVFWLGSEDHDIEELNHIYLSGRRIEWKDAGKGAIGRLKTESLLSLLPQLKECGVSDQMLGKIENGIQRYPSFGRFTQSLADDIFKETGLVVIDQDDRQLKEHFAPVILDEILNQRAAGVLGGNIDFLEAEYKVQAKPREINFFYLGDGYRERIVLNSDSGNYEVINTNLRFTKAQLITEVNEHPEKFSPNVIFRPLYQEMILPNLAFIGGAGELSYWLELKPLFEYYRVNYPVQVLRPLAAIAGNSTKKKVEKLGLRFQDFFEDIEQLINRYVKSSLGSEAGLEGEKSEIVRLFDALAEKAALADATLRQNVAAEKQKALSVIDNIGAKILKAEKRKQETAISQIRSVHTELFPEGVLQERSENFIPFYDDQFIYQVIENADVFTEKFRIFLKE